MFYKPFNSQEDTGEREEKEPILGYVPKNDEKKNLVHKRLMI